MHPLPFTVGNIKAQACGFCKYNRLACVICHRSAPCDNIKLRKNTVSERDLNIRIFILQNYLQGFRFGFICINCGKSFYTIFALAYAIAFVSQVKSAAAVRMNCRSSRYTIISNTVTGIFKRESIKGICAVVSCIINISRKAHIGIALQIFHITACFFAVPQVL